jgi:MFS family permease
MKANNRVRLAPGLRRRALTLGYVNGALWSAGNGLTTGSLVTYLAIDLGARGLGLSLMLAVPTLVGLLRLLAPPLIERLGTAKRAALTFSLPSYLLIWALPAAGTVEAVSAQTRLTFLIALVSSHQLLEYMGQVAIWSWFADLVPRPLRGRYFGRRQALQLAVLIPVLLASGHFTDVWRSRHESAGDGLLLAYAIPTAIGATFLLASLLPLSLMTATGTLARGPTAAGQFVPALRDASFRRLLLYGCWLSFFNGITQSPQNLFPKKVLGLGIQSLAAMRIAMQLGQIGVSGWAGRFSDRYGNRPTLAASQLALASAPLFFLVASPAQPGWLWGAWLCWSGYAGLNVCLPNLMLKMAGRQQVAAYVATYFGISSVFYAVSTVGGGYLFDLLSDNQHCQRLAAWGLDSYKGAFVVALAARLVAVVLVWRLIEPGAWTWRRIAARRLGLKPINSDNSSKL